jgi:hypothetical protein
LIFGPDVFFRPVLFFDPPSSFGKTGSFGKLTAEQVGQGVQGRGGIGTLGFD